MSGHDHSEYRSISHGNIFNPVAVTVTLSYDLDL